MRSIRLLKIPLVCCLFAIGTASANQPICYDYSSKIEPDLQRHETDFSLVRYERARHILETALPERMEKLFEHNKRFPNTYDKLYQGEIWLAHANATAIIRGYVLKLEYQLATEAEKETARRRFCTFVSQTPYFD